MGGTEITGSGSDHGNVIRIFPDADAIVGEPAPNRHWPLRLGVGLGVLGLTAAGLFVAARGGDIPEPEFLLSGPIPGANPDADVEGAVDLDCIRSGDRAVVNATVFLVTDRAGESGGDRGRIVQSQEIFDNETCADAVAQVEAYPTHIINDVVTSVHSAVTERVFGDGNFNAADKYQAAIDEAREDGVPEIKVEMRG